MYKLTRFVSYKEKNNVFAVYCNFNLYFFKNCTYKWFKDIIEFNSIKNVDIDFIDYLIKNEIIEECGECNA